ncbi:MAG TPA: phosphoenolpyruvate carboxykinase (ATP), partial [Flavobacterium sp.]|nr:phosphoenolpyruvate carboxykinase (ATP) [Flavobacterium sp.]
MDNYALFTKSISLKNIGIENATIHYQLSPDELHDLTVQYGQGIEVSTESLAVNTGEFTGRSPKDRFIVKDNISKDKVWWGNVNLPFEPEAFEALYKKVTAHIGQLGRVIHLEIID